MLPYVYWMKFSKYELNNNIMTLNENKPIHFFISIIRFYFNFNVEIYINFLKGNKKLSNYYINMNNKQVSFLILYWWVYFLMTTTFFYLF